MKALNPILLSGAEVLPLIEGGKGISVSNGESSGAWAAAGGVGTFSGVNADAKDEKGFTIPFLYKGKTRKERHVELVEQSIKGGITQAREAFDRACGQGRIHMNVLWEMAGCEEILNGILDGAKGLVHGVTCGAGMPYKLAEICASHNVSYYPIVSSARAFRALWKRTYHKFSDSLGAVVYEDPWRAGGHNGLSNSENPTKPESPYERVLALRQMMNALGAGNKPIIMAGGVWFLREWQDWIDNKELGPIAFQFGTRPLLTKESPISEQWKKMLVKLKQGDVFLNRFSPTGFYSSAVQNTFLQDLIGRSKRQIEYLTEAKDRFCEAIELGVRKRKVFVQPEEAERVKQWQEQGFTEALKTPDKTLVFVEPEKAKEIHKDQVDCMGCLSACNFSNWSQKAPYNTGRKADPRSFCIQKTLQDISKGSDVDQQLMFAGHNAYRFADDPFYANNHVPTVQELIERIKTGD